MSALRRTGACPRCGTVHNSAARFCRGCGLDFDSAEASALRETRSDTRGERRGGATLRERSIHRSATLAKIAGLVWLLVGGVTLVGFVGDLAGDGSIAAWAGVSAVLELLTGVVLFLRPGWEMLTASMLWGVLSIIGALFQITRAIPLGTTGSVLVIGIGVATGISWIARRPLLTGPDGPPRDAPEGSEATARR